MFSEKLKKLRQKFGMTQKQLADLVGVEKSSIAKYESDKGIMPSDDIKMKIADIFGVSLDYLMGRKQNDENEPLCKMDDETIEIMLLFNTLNSEGRKTVINTLRALSVYPGMTINERLNGNDLDSAI